MTRRVRLDPVHAGPALRAVAPTVRSKLKSTLRLLADDPSGRTDSLDVKRLDKDSGPSVYRAKIGDWRIAYSFDARLVRVVRIFHRSEGYGWLADLDA